MNDAVNDAEAEPRCSGPSTAAAPDDRVTHIPHSRCPPRLRVRSRSVLGEPHRSCVPQAGCACGAACVLRLRLSSRDLTPRLVHVAPSRLSSRDLKPPAPSRPTPLCVRSQATASPRLGLGKSCSLRARKGVTLPSSISLIIRRAWPWRACDALHPLPPPPPSIQYACLHATPTLPTPRAHPCIPTPPAPQGRGVERLGWGIGRVEY